MEQDALKQLSALSHPQRMAIFRLLMRHHPSQVPAGALARALGLKPSTASMNLSVLSEAGLVTQRRQGTSILYGADVPRVRGLIGYLWGDCCLGRPDLCPPLPEGLAAGAAMRPAEGPLYRVLFICTGNSARSLMAEAILRKLGKSRFEVHSAGTAPRAQADPIALEMLAAKGHDLSGLQPKPLSLYTGEDAPAVDFVFTVCDRAANEECPVPGLPVSAHWGLPDPVQAEGPEPARQLAYQQVYGALYNRLQSFAALPVEELDRMSLQAELDRLATPLGEPA